MGLSVSRLIVEGELALSPEDQAQWGEYFEEFVRHDGMDPADAEHAAWTQIAQDLLGGMGFVVDHVEPL